MTEPIELRLSSRRPRTVVGEGIVLDLHAHALAAIDVESPELNRARTSILIDPLQPGGARRILTGQDFIRVHKIHPLSEVGTRFRAAAGQSWPAAIELLNYSRPLPAGTYSISVSYRYGEQASDSVSTNPVQVEVRPADLVSAEYRWLGGASARDALACVWTVRDAEGEQWFYQNANAREPGAVQFAAPLGLVARGFGARPVQAHLNDIHGMHFEKYIVWEQDGQVGALKASRAGRSGEPRMAEHGLGPDAQLVDPPLQLRDGGLLAAVTGVGSDGRAAYSLVTFPASGVGSASVSPMAARARQALALWPVEEGDPLLVLRDSGNRITLMGGGTTGGTLLPQPVEELCLTQWLGSGTIGGFFRDGGFLRMFTMDLLARGNDPAINASYELARLPEQPGNFLAAASRPSGAVALMFETSMGWLVLDGGEAFLVRHPAGAKIPDLIATAGGLVLIHHDPVRGFTPEPVGALVPEQHL